MRFQWKTIRHPWESHRNSQGNHRNSYWVPGPSHHTQEKSPHCLLAHPNSKVTTQAKSHITKLESACSAGRQRKFKKTYNGKETLSTVGPKPKLLLKKQAFDSQNGPFVLRALRNRHHLTFAQKPAFHGSCEHQPLESHGNSQGNHQIS